jgi:hypothetical protein
MGNEGIAQILELRTDLLSAIIGKNTILSRNNTDSTLIDIRNSNTFTKRLLAVEFAMLIRYCYQTAETKVLYESTDAPSG